MGEGEAGTMFMDEAYLEELEQPVKNQFDFVLPKNNPIRQTALLLFRHSILLLAAKYSG